MRRLFLLAALLLGLAPPSARAAVTFAAGAECSNQTTITNAGLTIKIAPAAPNDFYICKASGANAPKYSGKWYYEFTYNIVGANSRRFGFFAGSAINGTYLSGNPIGADGYGVGIDMNDGKTWFNNHASVAEAIPTINQTGAIAVNLDTDPPQVWGTLNVANLICDGAGNTGTTAPQWNGACANDPSLPGTGHPNTGTGHVVNTANTAGYGVQLPGYAWYPAFSQQTFSNNATTQATFNFAGAFAGTLPAGYSAFDSAGGGAPTPGPTNPMTINIFNAPVHSNGATMTVGNAATVTPASRINAGPGCNASGYTNGSNCWVWQALNAGALAGSDPTAAWTCATPANTGGIYATSFPGASTQTDGAVTFACLYKVDYVTLTGFNADTPLTWTGSTAYFGNDAVLNSANQGYTMSGAATTTPFTCTSAASGGPTTVTMNSAQADNTCTWNWIGALTYSSQANRLPHQRHYIGSSQAGTIQYNYNVTVNIGYGGFDRQKYQPGVNGEASPIMNWYHDDFTAGDQTPQCYNAMGIVSAITSVTVGNPACNGKYTPFTVTYTVPPGDSAQDNIAAASGPLRQDSARGVMLYSTAAYVGTTTRFVTNGEPWALSDSRGRLTRLQILSTAAPCITSHNLGGPGNQRFNDTEIDNTIMDCGGGTAALMTDAEVVFHDDTIIFRSTTAGSTAISASYPGAMWNNTVIGTNATNGTFYTLGSDGQGFFLQTGAFWPPPIHNNAIFGFPHLFAYSAGVHNTTLTGDHNATDQTTDSGAVFTSAVPLNGSVTGYFPSWFTSSCSGGAGACTGLATTQFVSGLSGGVLCAAAACDLRLISTGADIYGAGASFSFTTNGMWMGSPLAQSATDLLNSARPTSARYDIGPAQFIPGATGGGGGSFLFGPFGAANDDAPVRMAVGHKW